MRRPRPDRVWPRLTSARCCPAGARSPAASGHPSWASAGRAWDSGPATAAPLANSAGASFILPTRPPRNMPASSMPWVLSWLSSRVPISSLNLSNLSSDEPTKRYGSGRSDGRLYFLWQGRGRKASDMALIRKAGIPLGEVVLQFYPRGVEEQLAQLEVRYRGRQPGEIRVTRFGVVPNDNGYGFKVIAQETLR